MTATGSTFRTDEQLLHELLEEVHKGHVQLPDFQRGWVWDDDHIRALIASVSLSYPIGAVIVVILGHAASGASPDEERSASSSGDGTNEQTMSLDDATAFRKGQLRVYLDHNGRPGFGEVNLTIEERVEAVIARPDGSRVFVIETHTVKREQFYSSIKKWIKDTPPAPKADPIGERDGFLLSGRRLCKWYEGSTRHDTIAEFPATDGAAFSVTFPSGEVETWRWSKVPEMKTEAGIFKNCFAATLDDAKGGTMRRTWCPEIGLVEFLLSNADGGEWRKKLVSFQGPGFPNKGRKLTTRK
jgi:hypothetical protein